jgi:ubiquinone/menaquinone biosynthesis C-methylase UbiE
MSRNFHYRNFHYMKVKKEYYAVNMKNYYSENLSAERLERCYTVAPPRVQQYLHMEIKHVLDRIGPGDIVLELGCGYGRAMEPLCEKALLVIGIDTSPSNIEYGHTYLHGVRNYRLFQMNAAELKFPDDMFDVVLCIQNGICAFHVDKITLVREAVRVTRPGGRVFFSSYAEKFWEDRLEWFYLQSREGLLGEIDERKTRNGIIVCKDGFEVMTAGEEEFRSLASEIGVESIIEEVDESSIFCEIPV